MAQDFVTVRLMSYQFGWLIQKLKMEEDKLSLSFNTWLAYGVNQNHIENHNKSGIKNIYIFQFTDQIITVSRAARTVCDYIIIDSKIIIPQKWMTNTF